MTRMDSKTGRRALAAAFFAVIAVTACACAASGGLLVPGQNDIILRNLATEYYNVAEAYVDVKNYAKAAEYYKLAMRDEGLYLTAYYKLARSYALAKDWDNALPIYEDLLSRDSENGELAASVAYITAMRGDTDAALVMYQSLLEKYPSEQRFLENYISLLVDSGRGELAEAQVFVLKEKFPDSTLLSSFASRIAELVDTPDPNAAQQKMPAEVDAD